MKTFCLLAATLVLTGCSLIPKYERPSLPVAPQFPYSTETDQKMEKAASAIGYRDFFKDQRLQKFIELALNNNRDLRVVLLNVEQAKAQNRLLSHALLPSIELDAGSVHQRSASTEGEYTRSSKYTAVIDTAYELDFFGRVRSIKSQVLEKYLATQEARRSAQIALMAQVAVQYLSERAISEQLSLVKQTFEVSQKNYDLIKKSYDLGARSELDLRAAESQLESARAQFADYERQQGQALDALVLLLGQSLPADLPVAQSLQTQDFFAELPAGLPSDLLIKRPDILAAEHQLKSANANIGAVRAAFFPQITLTGDAGFSSVKLTDLLSGGSGVWNFSPKLTLPIFNQKNNIANLDIVTIEKRIEIAQYEKALQTAFREVSDALIARVSYKKQVAALEALSKAAKKRYDLAEARYKSGVDSYLAVLTAQQDLYSAQQSLIQARFLSLANIVSLYKALGGGSDEFGMTEVHPTEKSKVKVKVKASKKKSQHQ